MKVFDNYSEYLHQKEFYDDWKRNRNDVEAKRAAYVASGEVSEQAKKSDIKRAEAVLNAIDVMDEFSQARAEDMEVATEQAKGLLAEIGTWTTMGIGGGWYMLSKSLRNNINEVFKNKNYKVTPKLILPAIITLAPILTCIVVASVWGAGTETRASRFGRAEAINKKLNSLSQFAELDDKQEAEVEKIASEIKLSPKEAKKAAGISKKFGFFKAIKSLFVQDEKEQFTIDKINYQIYADKKKFDKYNLSEKDILEAKRDKQLIQNVVEKIDIASQEYAENVELATSAVTTTALCGGILTGYITKAITKRIPSLATKSNYISVGVGVAIPLLMSLYAAKIQKQASRVGRYKVKQDFMNNPEKLIYVDDDKAKNQDGSQYITEKKKPGFFKFLAEAVRNNNEYEKYLKTNFVEAKKKSMAREKIELTDEQKERAKQLQTNTFKMFNKLDEKSQSFSESVEALGEIVSSGLGSIIMLAGAGWGTIYALTQKATKQSLSKKKYMLITYTPAVISLLIANLLNIYVTKEQKQASKVANMLAINDLEDYRNFVNYEKLENQQA